MQSVGKRDQRQASA